MFDRIKFLKKMRNLREEETGLDGTIICQGGGLVRVHLTFIACCNDYLFRKVRSILQQETNVLIAKEMMSTGVEDLMSYCYSGDADYNRENFAQLIDAALAFEFKEVVEGGIAFLAGLETDEISNLLWGKCLDVLKKYIEHTFLTLPQCFIPNLICGNIAAIPRKVLLNKLKWPHSERILLQGAVPDRHRIFTINAFLEIFIQDTMGEFLRVDILLCMKNLYDDDTTSEGNDVVLPSTIPESILISILDKAVHAKFTSLVNACAKESMNWPPSGKVLGQILQLTNTAETAKTTTTPLLKSLYQYAAYCITKLPGVISKENLIYLVSSDWLEVEEFSIFKAVISWITQNQVNARTKHGLLSLVRFGLMTKEQIENIIMDFSDVMQGCSDVLILAMQYHLKPYEQPLYGHTLSRMRSQQPVVFIVGGRDRESDRSKNVHGWKVGADNGKTSIIFKISETPVLFDNSACALVGGFLFICGGEMANEKGSGDVTWRLDPRTNTWLELSPMGLRRQEHTCTATESTLIVVGGFNSKLSSDIVSVEVYNIGNNTWEPGPCLPQPSSQHAACSVDGCVFISGGTPGDTLLTLRPALDVSSTWGSLAPMSHSRQTHGMIASGSKLFVAGGSVNNGSKWVDQLSTECYSIPENQWSDLAPPRLTCSFGLSVCLGNRFYVIGGMGALPLLDIQQYDMDKDEWKMCETKLPMELSNMCGGLITA